jgi:hypothetical protein
MGVAEIPGPRAAEAMQIACVRRAAGSGEQQSSGPGAVIERHDTHCHAFQIGLERYRGCCDCKQSKDSLALARVL